MTDIADHAEEIKSLLKALEFPVWVDDGDSGHNTCAICNGVDYEEGHRPGCRLAILMKALGIEQRS